MGGDNSGKLVINEGTYVSWLFLGVEGRGVCSDCSGLSAITEGALVESDVLRRIWQFWLSLIHI